MSKVVKRASYSVIRNEKDDKRRVLQFSRMIMSNPGVLKYFKNRNPVSKPFVRLSEILKMTLFSEQHRRKEEIRSALYAFCEDFMGDKRLMHSNMNHRVTDLLKSVKENIENDTSIDEEKKNNIVEVLNEVLEEGLSANKKKGIDTSKIIRDKEWYRGFIRLLAAAGVFTGSLFLIPPQEANVNDYGILETEKTQLVDRYNNCTVEMKELERGIRGCKDKLDNCEKDNSALASLASLDDRRCPSNITNRDVVRANKKLRRINNKLKQQLDKLRKQLNDQNKEVTLSEDFKQSLMRKVDLIFYSVIPMHKENNGELSSDEMYYKSDVRPWFKKKIDEGNMDVVWMVISMGGELFKPIIDSRGHVFRLEEFKNAQEFWDAYEKDNIVYPGSIKNGLGNSRNTRPGTVSALFDVYLDKYDLEYDLD